ncbi:MAG: DNA primase [bacterium]
MAAPERGYGDVERVREATDIVAVMGQYVALTPAGENLKGLCPFHADTKPSLTVSPAKQLYYCFGCGEGGNVFSFVMKMEGLTFGEALRELAKRAGIPLRAAGRATPQEKRRDRLAAVVEEAARFFEGNLRASDPYADAARRYLLERGLTEKTLDEWRLGLVADSWDSFLKHAARAGYEAAELGEAGLAVTSKSGSGYYDRFRGRIIFPIWNASGRVVAFGGRALGDGEPKYLNSSNTSLYNKSTTLYGLYQNRGAIARSGSCVVVEGYMDLLGVHQAGVENVVATCGTSLAEEAAAILARHATDFVMLFDGDDAGLRAARRALALLLAGGARRVRVGVLESGQDPFDVAAEGPDALAAVLDGAVDWPAFVVELARREHAGDSVGAELAAIGELRPLLAAVPEELERSYWRRRAADLLGIPVGVVTAPARPARGAGDVPPATPAEHNLLRILIHCPAAAAECLAEISLEDVVDEQVQRVLRVMAKLVKNGPFSTVELLDELDAADAGVVTRLAMAEAREEDAARAARLAVKAVKQRALARRARELRERIAASGGEYADAAPAIKELVEEKRRYIKREGGR